jgi:endonuclease/exonuclease/phosphatase family metal-dependent hydrolase
MLITSHVRSVRTVLASLLTMVCLAAGLAVSPETQAAPSGAPPGKPVTVMTRNLYLGGDITRPLDATSGKTGVAALLAFGQANHVLAGIVDRTDFPARAASLAREIATNAPDVVGLQEVALWRHGDMQIPPNPLFGEPNAQTVDYDFLQTLLDELAALGADYRAAEVQEESDVEGPAFATQPADGTGRDVRLTMRDAILVRGGIKVAGSHSAQYLTRIGFDLAGRTFSFIRGYNWVDVTKGTKQLRVVNTHLESQSSGIAAMQAGELLAGPAHVTGRPVVVVCDCNSDPLNGTGKPQDPTPHWTAYRLLTGSGLFDEWKQWSATDPGFTSGFNELVNDADASAIDHRIDLVLAHGADGRPLRVDRGAVVGTDPAEKVGALWPSDHAGVVLRLRP